MRPGGTEDERCGKSEVAQDERAMAGTPDDADDQGVTTTATGTVRGKTGTKRVVLIAIVVLIVVLVVPPPWFASGQPVGWVGARDALGGELGPMTTRVEVGVYAPPESDPAYSEFDPGAPSWLGTPTVIYTPWSVIVTLHTSAAFDTTRPHGWSFEPTYVPIQLVQPLLGRTLVDGSGGAIPGPVP